jgi:dipeptidyl aminopeptidase/acylaminoacyl peptidase
MKVCIALLGLLGLLNLDGASDWAGGVGSAMSWSPDSQWLSYTLVTASEPEHEPAGWLFDTALDRQEQRPSPALDAVRADLGGPATYRIWTTRRDGQSTVLIEESRWPLSTPSWGVEGRSIAFSRFVPRPMAVEPIFPRGRFEVVVQDTLDRKRVVWTQPELELDPETRAALLHIRTAWSSDGVTLAIPVPGREPAITVVRTDVPKVVLALQHASCPSWSPDGSRLAFVRKTGRNAKVVVVERQGEGFGATRDVAPTGPVLAPVGWAGDGRSVLLVSERLQGRSYEVDLVRRAVDGPDNFRTITLVPSDAIHRGAVLRGITIDFDREGEHCIFAVDYVGRDSAMVTALPSERQILRPFNPLDVSQRIAAVAISPDGHTVAARFGPPDSLTPPAVCDWASEQPTTLLVPDRTAKRLWSARLVTIARGLLAAGLPKLAVDGQVAKRPTLLPIPGELSPDNPIQARVNRIARFGAILDAFGGDDVDRPTDPSGKSADLETRLFFLYLAGDYVSAATALDALEGRLAEPEHRLAALSIKAQILWAQGERSRAQAVIDFLQGVQGAETRRIEETPFGPVVTKEVNCEQAWARHLAKQAATHEPPKPPDNTALQAEPSEQPLHDSIVPAPPQPIEGRGGDVPLPPIFRRLDGVDRQ